MLARDQERDGYENTPKDIVSDAYTYSPQQGSPRLHVRAAF